MQEECVATQRARDFCAGVVDVCQKDHCALAHEQFGFRAPLPLGCTRNDRNLVGECCHGLLPRSVFGREVAWQRVLINRAKLMVLIMSAYQWDVPYSE